MKKNLFAFCVLTGLALMGSACSHIEASKVGPQVNVKMPVLIAPQVEAKNELISGSATVHSILGIISWGPNTQAVGVNYGVGAATGGGPLGDLLSFTTKSENVARNAAAYEATNKAKADLILAPQYVMTTKDYFVYKQINCKVKGYPGFIKDLKVIDDIRGYLTPSDVLDETKK